MYSIGEFSRRTQISIQTLRLYDREGLLKPAVVDADTGYRYYQPTQILAAEEIRFLRDCEVPLETIARLLRMQARGADREMLGLLENHEPVIQGKMHSMQRMQRRIRSLRLELAGDPESGQGRAGPDAGIEVVQSRSRIVVATRKFGDYEDVVPLIEELTDFALSNGLRIEGPPMLMWGEVLSAARINPEADAEVEVAIPVSGRFVSTTDLLRRRLPACVVARLVFRGDRSDSGLHYERLFSWVRENDCEVTGAFREIYHNLPGTVEPEEYLTELQVPVNIEPKRDS